MKKYLTLNSLFQLGLVFSTMLGFLLISLKQPAWGLLVSLASQVFWLYSSYKSWKDANQIGIFINTIFMTLIIIYGVLNYWIF